MISISLKIIGSTSPFAGAGFKINIAAKKKHDNISLNLAKKR